LWVLSHKLVVGPILETSLYIVGDCSQIIEWLEADIEVIQVWIWCLWEIEKCFSFVEFFNFIYSFKQFFFKLIGISRELLRLFKVCKLLDFIEVLLVLNKLL
jgi:hypothetical protein